MRKSILFISLLNLAACAPVIRTPGVTATASDSSAASFDDPGQTTVTSDFGYTWGATFGGAGNEGSYATAVDSTGAMIVVGSHNS